MSVAQKVVKKTLDGKVLKKLVPLNTLSADKLRELLDKSMVEQYGPGRTLFRSGDSDTKTYYLLSGEVEISPTRGPAFAVKADSPQAAHPLSNARPRMASAITKSNVSLLVIDTNLLDVVTGDHSRAGYQVADIHSENQDDWITRFIQSLATINVPVKNIEALIRRMQEVEVQAGEAVVRQAEKGEHFYLLKEGRAVVTKQATPDKSPIRVAELGAGAAFGEESLLADQLRNATITMLSDGRLMRLSKTDFMSLIAEPALRTLSPQEAAKMAQSGAMFVDVRSESEFRESGLRGAVNIPLATLRQKTKELNVYGKYIVYCDTGSRSSAAAFILRQQGYDAYLLDQSQNKEDAPVPSSPPPAPALKVAASSAETRVEAVQVRELASGSSTDVVQMEKRLKAMEAQLSQAQTELRSTQDHERETTAKLEQAVAEREKEMETARREISALTKRMSTLDNARAGAERELARLKETAQHIDVRAHERDAQKIAQLDAERREAAQEIARLKAQLEARTREEVESHQRVDSAIDHVAAELAEQKKVTQAAIAEKDEASVRAMVVQGRLQEAQEELQQLTSAYQTLRADMQHQMQHWQSMQDAHAAELEDLKQHMQRETDRRTTAEQALRTAQSEAARLRDEAEAQRQSADDLARRVDELTNKHKQMLQELLRKIDIAEAQRAEAERQSAQLRESADMLRRKAEEETRKYAQAEAARVKAIEESERRNRVMDEMHRRVDAETAQLKVEAEAARSSADEARKKSALAEAARRQVEDEMKRQTNVIAQMRVAEDERQQHKLATNVAPEPTREPEKARKGDDALEDLEQELARLQEKLEAKKRAAISRKAEHVATEQKREPEIAQNVYNLQEHLKTQRIASVNPNDTTSLNVSKVQKSGWISDAILWETTLGLRNDNEAEQMLSGSAPATPPVNKTPNGERMTHSMDSRGAPQSRPLFTSRDISTDGSSNAEIAQKRAAAMQREEPRRSPMLLIAGAITLIALGGGIYAYTHGKKTEPASAVILEKSVITPPPAPTNTDASGSISRAEALPAVTEPELKTPAAEPAPPRSAESKRAKAANKNTAPKAKAVVSAPAPKAEASTTTSEDTVTPPEAKQSDTTSPTDPATKDAPAAPEPHVEAPMNTGAEVTASNAL